MAKAKRQSRRRGSVQELEPGRYAAVAPVGKDPLTGKRLRITRVVHGTRQDAERGLTALLGEIDAGKHSPDLATGEATTYEELTTRWLAQREAEGLSPTTLARYRHAGGHLTAHLGGRQPHEVTAQALDALYARLVKAGLKGSSIRKVHQVARGVGDMAIRYRLATENPALGARPPKVVQAQTDAPSDEQIKALIEEAEYQNPTLGMMLRLGCATGARRGELLALRWSDIEVDAVLIRRGLVLDGNDLVERGTKTGNTRRVSIDKQTAQALEDHRVRCVAACAVAGGEPLADGFLFSVQPDGSKPYRPDSVTQWFSRRADNLGIKTTWYQATRHWHASVGVAAGHDVRTLADRLGHDPAVLLKRYAHLRPGKDQETADLVGGLLA